MSTEYDQTDIIEHLFNCVNRVRIDKKGKLHMVKSVVPLFLSSDSVSMEITMDNGQIFSVSAQGIIQKN